MGVNWILLSIVKILAVSSNSADFQKLGVAADLATLATMLNCRRRGHPGIPEFRPFVLLFGLEMIALGMLAFAECRPARTLLRVRAFPRQLAYIAFLQAARNRLVPAVRTH